MPDHDKPSQTALTALEEAVLFSLQLDKDILEKYSAPRKQLYKEYLYQIFQQEQGKELKKRKLLCICVYDCRALYAKPDKGRT
jgi:hypothetical protein